MVSCKQQFVGPQYLLVTGLTILLMMGAALLWIVHRRNRIDRTYRVNEELRNQLAPGRQNLGGKGGRGGSGCLVTYLLFDPFVRLNSSSRLSMGLSCVLCAFFFFFWSVTSLVFCLLSLATLSVPQTPNPPSPADTHTNLPRI